MNDQRATTDQINTLAALVEFDGMVDEATWLRTLGQGPLPSELDRWTCIRVANRHGLYDAADWIRGWSR